MPKKFISIQEASDLSAKSIQTIRRAVKSKKLNHRKIKTPQGFNYLINYDSLCSFYKIKPEPNVKNVLKEEVKSEEKVEKKISKNDGFFVTSDDFKNLTTTLEKMVHQHSEERQNFIRLVDTLQEKIFVLENQLNLLKSPDKRWYQFWR
jgi:hypothetical protein